MKRADFQTAFLKSLVPYLSELGFDPRLRDQSFCKKVPLGRQCLHISFVPYSTEINVTADVAVRIDAVEKLLNSTRSKLSKAQTANTYTVGAELGNIAQGSMKVFHLSYEEDIENVAALVAKYFKEVGLPFFDNFSTPEAILECLLKNDRRASLYSPFDGKRWRVIVGLAVYLKKYDLARRSILEGESYLQSRNDWELSEFRQFAERVVKNHDE